ncbi:MAG TPA: SulP family inorganic anion transporter [Parachlamydiaceae bacterium]|nr:SulP family inorganic anion transporter [Parachlamydiaceae bacterium]
MEGYSWNSFRLDLSAAVSVALLTVPQAMAYALLAGLPLTAGLFAAIYSSIIASLFGSSRHLIVGPSNAIAILLQAGTAEILFTYYRGVEGPERDVAAMQILTQLCMLVGVIQVLAAGCKLGRLTQFVSHSVIVAYIAGTAIAVVVNQLFTFVGIPNTLGGDSLYEKAVYLVTHLPEIHWPTALIGAGSLLLLIVLKKVDNRIPAPLIALVLAALLVHVLANYSFAPIITEETLQKYWQNVLVVGDTGSLSQIWPAFAFPHFDMGLLNHLLPFAFAVALLNIMETTSIAKTLAASSGQRLSVNQEIFGIGLGNLVSSIISAMPVSGSASRSCLSASIGAQTRMAALLNAGIVAGIIYCFSFLVMHVPLAALSALLLVTAVNIVNPRQFFLCLKATNSDAFVLWMTLISCIFLSLDIALYVGIVISITLYLKKAAIPQLIEYDIDDDGELHNIDYSKIHEHKTIRVIKVEGELFFGAADLFQTTLKTIAEDDTSTKVIVLQLKNARDIDATVCLALQQLHGYLKGSGRYLIACGMTQQIWDVLSDSGLIEQIGKENLFVFDERHPHQHMVKALHKARHLAALSVEPILTPPAEEMQPAIVVESSLANLKAD